MKMSIDCPAQVIDDLVGGLATLKEKVEPFEDVRVIDATINFLYDLKEENK